VVQKRRQGMFCWHPHRAPVEMSIDSMIFSGYSKQEAGYLVKESASLSNNQIGMGCKKSQLACGVER
jgi:hypothetical protein